MSIIGISPQQLNIIGLTDEEVRASRQRSGTNALKFKREHRLVQVLKSLAGEPMVILLLLAAILYFISGQTGEAIFMTGAILAVAGISLYQDARSRNALEKLKTYTQPTCNVIRNGEVQEVASEELVPGDHLIIEEGTQVPADGEIVHSNDLSLNESILTGESLPVMKDKTGEDARAYAGTTVVSGLAIIRVSHIGNDTRLGAIGLSLESIEEEKTPLERQIRNFVKQMVIAGSVIFLIVWVINYLRSASLIDSLLKALTLAMSILPEEIPVAFTTFMALGAWRLMKMGIVVKQMKTVESLGSANVICVDKTGTITENRMVLAGLYPVEKGEWTRPEDPLGPEEEQLISLAMWASEPLPFDPMEHALHERYGKLDSEDERPLYNMAHEYPLSGTPPMMTHVFETKEGKRIIAAKGAPEALMAVSGLDAPKMDAIQKAVEHMALQGYRVLGVGEALFPGNDLPKQQQQLPFVFRGLVAFHDPPKANMPEVLQHFYKAGINVKIITGDNEATARAIAGQVGFLGAEKSMNGDALMQLKEADLQRTVMDNNLFTRTFPDAKLKIINALKANDQIVAMTGDGVNDGPALKAAHIGIAMGKKGTEIARQAASLVLIEDDLARMVDAVAMGRRIYTNLKKAIQYIISIHIPIILTVFIPLALGWVYPNIFTPVHIIFMELIMGPTCSIVYENEPMEKNTMLLPPKPFTTTFFNWKELSLSVFQGLAITAGALWTYQYAVQQGHNEALTRTMTFTVLIAANIFLTLVNRSFYYSIFTTLAYKNNLIMWIIGATILIYVSLMYVPAFTRFFGLETLSPHQLGVSVLSGFLSVIWFEGFKWLRRRPQ